MCVTEIYFEYKVGMNLRLGGLHSLTYNFGRFISKLLNDNQKFNGI